MSKTFREIIKLPFCVYRQKIYALSIKSLFQTADMSVNKPIKNGR